MRFTVRGLLRVAFQRVASNLGRTSLRTVVRYHVGKRRAGVPLRGTVLALAIAVAVPLLSTAESTPASARSEIRLQFADLLFADERFWEAIPLYDIAKRGATPSQLVRAATGLLRSLMQVAEFNRAYIEAETLRELEPRNPDVLVLYGDAMWAAGLFEEAERAYRDALALAPGHAGGRHGVARSLLARNILRDALTEASAAIKEMPSRPEFYHTLGSIYRRLNRFSEAATAMEQYAQRLPNGDRSDKVRWALTEVRFLRSFEGLEPLQFDPGKENDLFTIPFRLVNDKLVVRAKINGNETTDLVVDTGAEQMVLSDDTANEVGVRAITNALSAGVGDVGLRGLEAGRIDSLEVGPLKVANLPTLIKNPPLTGLPSRRVPDSFSPISLGLSTIIDYGQHHLIMGRQLPDEPADIELPMRVYRLAVVRGIVNQTHPKSFVIDTGGEVISISLSTAAQLGMQPVRHIPLRVFGTSGWDEDAYLLPGVDLEFDRIHYENFAVVVLNLHRPSALLGFHIGGIVGHRFLSDYRATIDLNRSVLRLKAL